MCGAAEPGGRGGGRGGGGLGISRAMRHHRTYTVMCPRGGRGGRTHEQEGGREAATQNLPNRSDMDYCALPQHYSRAGEICNSL